jgi:nucleoside-diphosphate-sugar epimerase
MLNRHLARDAADVITALGDRNAAFSGTRVVLTGAAGFLGAHFMHYFCALNDSGVLDAPVSVLALDSFARGEPHWLAPMRSRSDVEFRVHDVVQPIDVGAADWIIHGASIASPTWYRRYPIETMDANVIGLRRLLDHAVARPPRGMLFFSTSEIYGDPDPAHIPTAEDYRGNVSCTGPRACYDESKRYGETLCTAFHSVHGVPVTTVRPFNNYGPGLKITDRRIVPDLFRDVLAGRDLVLLSDGRATRTFCYASDATTGYLLALTGGYPGTAFNIGADAPEISMRELASEVIRASGRDLRVVQQASDDPHYLTDNPQRRCPDLTRARNLLGYAPRISLADGLSRTWDWYQDHHDDGEG